MSNSATAGRLRRVRRAATTALAAASLAALLLVPATALAAEETITFASDTTWTVTDGDAAVGPAVSLPGAAQLVCLNASFPVPCPAGATQYGYAGGGWGADLASIPGAAWIWAPGIDGATEPADADVYEFSKTIDVPGTPTGGSISVAVDDSASVWVNGTNVGSAATQGPLTVIDITANLAEGSNTIVVRGTNGVQCGRPCTYAENPAGVVFGGSITYEPEVVDPGTDPTPVPTAPPTTTAGPTSAGDGPAWPAAATLVAAFAVASLAFVGAQSRRPRATGSSRGTGDRAG